MTITIKDLANMAGTSTATVSRVLSNKPGVAEDKRQNILQLASKVGYTPNRIAQNLALQKSHVIGLIAAELRSSSYVEFFRRIQHTLEKMQYRVLIADSELDVEKERQSIASLREQRVEGLMIFPVHDWRASSNIEHFLELKLQKFPFVIVGRIEGYGFDYVTCEETETAEQLTNHLLSLGHRKFVFVGNDPDNRCVVERRRGVEAALKAKKLQLMPYEFPNSGDQWLADFRTMLQSSNRPTALIFINDVTALMGYRVIQELGIRVPEQISVASFGDNIWSRYLYPALTTTSENNPQIAQVALEALMRRIENPSLPPSQQMLPQELLIRESTGPAPK